MHAISALRNQTIQEPKYQTQTAPTLSRFPAGGIADSTSCPDLLSVFFCFWVATFNSPFDEIEPCRILFHMRRLQLFSLRSASSFSAWAASRRRSFSALLLLSCSSSFLRWYSSGCMTFVSAFDACWTPCLIFFLVLTYASRPTSIAYDRDIETRDISTPLSFRECTNARKFFVGGR